VQSGLPFLTIFYEIVSICTYPLVAHHQDDEGYSGGRKYLVYLTATAKAFLLPAMILIYVLTGTLDFAPNISTGIFPPDVNKTLVIMLYVFCIFGFAKNGVMPFHHWLPGAMVAPTPVSALLHAVAVVKVGVFCTTRVMLYVFGTDTMHALNLGIPTAYFVGITVLAASIIALSKDNLKARLAYSTVSQLSYITKWNLLIGSVQAHQIGILLILIASTMLNAAYFAPITYKAFFGKRPVGEKFEGVKEAPLSMLIPILIACAVSVLIGIFPNFMLQFVKAVTG